LVAVLSLYRGIWFLHFSLIKERYLPIFGDWQNIDDMYIKSFLESLTAATAQAPSTLRVPQAMDHHSLFLLISTMPGIPDRPEA
jgi:hypothetical protein